MTLEKEHIEHLDNIAFGGLMRTITPDDVAAKLIEQGHIRKGVGGYMATKTGYEALGKK